MIDENLVQQITRLVVQKIMNLQKKVLVVYTNTDKNAGFALESLQNLKTQGFKYDVLMSRNAYEIYDIEAIKNKIQPDNLWVECNQKRIEELSLEYDLILVPALTVGAAACLAACMTNDDATNVILHALMYGKKVVIFIDGCCPDCLSKDSRFNIAEPLKQKLKENLKVLQSYGARLTTIKHMMNVVLESMNIESVNLQKTLDEKNLSKVFSGKLLSAKEIDKYVVDGILRIKSETIVTQLAKEVAQERAIKIIIET